MITASLRALEPGVVGRGGRAGEAATTHLAEQIAEVGITTARFKTGTPPRIEGNSVDTSVLQRQDSEIDAFDYAWSAFWTGPRSFVRQAQAPCWITFAGAPTKDIARLRQETGIWA